MAAPRKVFRIEEMAGARLSRRSNRAPAWHEREALPTDPQAEALQAKALQAEVQQALGAFRATMAATTHAANGDGDAKQPGLDAAQLMRIAQELDAVVSGTAQCAIVRNLVRRHGKPPRQITKAARDAYLVIANQI